jgi:hypothetical protein
MIEKGKRPAISKLPQMLAVAVAAPFLFLAPCASAASKPNVVLFVVDDMGWMDSGAYGSKYYETPHMDRLATQAMRFTDAYALPLCSPTRASILTGQYSARHRVTSATGHLPPASAGASAYPEKAPPSRALIYADSKNYLDPKLATWPKCCARRSLLHFIAFLGASGETASPRRDRPRGSFGGFTPHPVLSPVRRRERQARKYAGNGTFANYHHQYHFSH